MVTRALTATQHLARWLVWHSMRVSLLPDAEHPRGPGEMRS